MTELNARPVLLIVHGALGSGAQMEPLAAVCRDSAVFDRVDVLELPGHGATPLDAAGSFTMPAFAESIRARISAYGARRVVVFGYSMGGYAALLAEATHSGLCAGIVTLGTMVTWTPAVAESGARRLNAEGIRSKVPAFAELLSARHADAGGWELTLERTAALLRSLGDAPPLTPDVCARIRTPVLLMVGSRDDSVTLAETEVVAQQMAHAEAAGLDDVPHPIEKVPLDVLVSRLTGFVSSLPRE